MVCAIMDVVACVEEKSCVRVSANDFELPEFIILDGSKKVIRAAYFSTPAQADDAAAFFGGVIATKFISNAKRRADAEEAQAAVMQQHRSVPATSAPQSPEERLKELDKLAAGGYITPEEYKRKKRRLSTVCSYI